MNALLRSVLTKRAVAVRTVIGTIWLLFVGVTAAGAQSAAGSTPQGDGWRTTVYPVYAWLPVFGAELRLPEITNPPPCDGCGDGGPIVPGGSVSSTFNGAAFAAVLVENRWVQAEVNFLYAGLSADRERPNLRVKVTTTLGSAHVGVRVVPDLFVSGGVRRVALNIKATALVFDEVQWKPGVWQAVAGASYTPWLSPRWRLLAQADYGGIGDDDHSSYTATASLEWHPLSHLAINMGYGIRGFTSNGILRERPIHVEQTLHGPILGIGFPF